MVSYDEKRAETERLMALLPEVRERLMSIPGVSRVAVGIRERAGQLTEEFVFRVHVDEKLPLGDLPADQVIPAEIAGVPTDVVVKRMPVNEIGFNDENAEGEFTPKVGGTYIGAQGVTDNGIGTLGCFCRVIADDRVLFLSNWHVLIDPGGKIGDGVGHPSWRKSCCCTTGKIGEIVDFDEALDSAIGVLDQGIAFASKTRRITRADNTIEQEGRIEGGTAPAVGDEVWKIGARTGLTRGIIVDADANEVEIQPLAAFPRMSNRGDSGAVYVSNTNGMVCVLHNQGDGTNGFGIPFNRIMNRYNLEVIPTGIGDFTVSAPADERPSSVVPPFDAVVERMRESAAGQELLRIVERHRDECLELVDRHRRFTVAWHRSQGPAYLAALARSARDPDYRIPDSFAGLSRAEAAHRVATAVRACGSPELVAALDEHGPLLARAIAEGDTVEEILRTWEESRQPVG